MFRTFIRTNQGFSQTQAETLFNLHPHLIASFMEIGWENRVHNNNEILGSPNRRSNVTSMPDFTLSNLLSRTQVGQGQGVPTVPKGLDMIAVKNNSYNRIRWDHLIYAYLIENTNVVSIFKKVLKEFLYGEKLGVPTQEVQNFLRSTEELFFRMPPSYSIINLVSRIRPDINATRRNAYWRFFGMDLNFGKGGVPTTTSNKMGYPYYKPAASNTAFVDTLQKFLQEVWIGIANARNQMGFNHTDDAAIANHARQLYDMLSSRRINGNLAREEFFAVSMMSWFHLALEFNSPIVLALRAEGSRPDQRLANMANRVGMDLHANAYDFFTMSEPLSRVLTVIETGILNTAANASTLYIPQNGNNQLAADMQTIITHWSKATGSNLKTPNAKYGKNGLATPANSIIASVNGNGVPALAN